MKIGEEPSRIENEVIIQSQDKIPNKNESENVKLAKTLVEKGYFSNEAEAEGFTENLSKTLKESERIKNGLDDFQESLQKIFNDAEGHLVEIESSRDVKLLDKAADFKRIATEIGADFDYINNSKEKQSGENVAWKLGKWVAKHKMALVAFGVFSAAMRLGGGIAHASDVESGFDGISAETYSPQQESFDENEIIEASEFIEQNSESKHEKNVEKINSNIEEIHALIEAAEGKENAVVANFGENTTSGQFDVNNLQKSLKQNGHLQFSVQSYVEVQEGMATENVLSMEQLQTGENNQEHSSDDLTMVSMQGENPEQAVLLAMNELGNLVGGSLSGSTEINDGMLASENIKFAASNNLDITTLNIESQITTDEQGVQHITYMAHVGGYKI